MHVGLINLVRTSRLRTWRTSIISSTVSSWSGVSGASGASLILQQVFFEDFSVEVEVEAALNIFGSCCCRREVWMCGSWSIFGVKVFFPWTSNQEGSMRGWRRSKERWRPRKQGSNQQVTIRQWGISKETNARSTYPEGEYDLSVFCTRVLVCDWDRTQSVSTKQTFDSSTSCQTWRLENNFQPNLWK